MGNTVQINSVGFPASSYFLYEQVYDETGTPIEGLYVDRNGDGVVNPDDLYRTENPAPDYFLGLNSSFEYKGLSLSFSARANLGNYIYNNVWSDFGTYASLYNSAGFWSNVHSSVNDIRFQNPQYLSDHFLQDGSFIRFDYITLAYQFGSLFNNTINSLGISATVQNPFVITNYEGIDPEIFGGIDNNIYPRARTFVFGLNASF